MRKELVIITAGVIASAALYGQNLESGVQSYQFAVASSSPENRMFSYTTIGSPVVPGRPYSATEERRSTQTLGDGTHIETTETNRLFRDEQGRTRTERKDGNVSIYDPIAGFHAELDPATKTATKMMVAVRAAYGRGSAASTAPGDAEAKKRAQDMEKMEKITVQLGELKNLTSAYAGEYAQKAEAGVTIRKDVGEPGGPMRIGTFTAAAGPTVLRVEPGNNGAVESLPAQMINGILSQGTRTTETIPVGKIGNDRVISVVNERWYSNELQMLIRSSSTDPRFGNSTYQLTNILTTSPDPSLFQIPGDYTIKK